MMRKLAILCATAAASAGLAQALADPPASKAREAEGDPDQLVCRTEPQPGSRMRRRICLTRSEWKELKALSRAAADDMQRFKPPACGPDTNTAMMC
jgi:hypothetical protein